jgi:hypothetical protein
MVAFGNVHQSGGDAHEVPRCDAMCCLFDRLGGVRARERGDRLALLTAQPVMCPHRFVATAIDDTRMSRSTSRSAQLRARCAHLHQQRRRAFMALGIIGDHE